MTFKYWPDTGLAQAPAGKAMVAAGAAVAFFLALGTSPALAQAQDSCVEISKTATVNGQPLESGDPIYQGDQLQWTITMHNCGEAFSGPTTDPNSILEDDWTSTNNGIDTDLSGSMGDLITNGTVILDPAYPAPSDWGGLYLGGSGLFFVKVQNRDTFPAGETLTISYGGTVTGDVGTSIENTLVPGTGVENADGGAVVVTCTDAGCETNNPIEAGTRPAPVAVPTLSEWAMIGLMAMLAAMGAVGLRRRRRN